MFQIQHQTHLETLLKFIGLIFLLAGYFIYMSLKYDASTGIGLSLLTWSFFVLCTPIADGGFVLAFPFRLLFHVRMWITQALVWVLAIVINLCFLFYWPETYQLSLVTNLLQRILTEPYPYWSILLISALGTFLSIYFGDEMMDVTNHKSREKFHTYGFSHKVIVVIGLSILMVFAYYQLLGSLNIQLPGNA